MYASDLHSELWEIRCDLFRDRDAMKARFVQADIFDPDNPRRDLDGKIDIIVACQFLHLFSWKQQVDAAKRIVDMSRPATCLVGYQVGRKCPAEVQTRWGSMFHHDVGSFNEVWRQVARETGTRWIVDASLVSCGEWALGEQGFEWHCA